MTMMRDATILCLCCMILHGVASPEVVINPTFTLRDGSEMPQVGLGVHQARPGYETYKAVRDALSIGYRLFDTAANYENEHDVGRAIMDSRIPREEIFVTTKLDVDSHGYNRALQATEERLRLLNTSYIDLLLIHSPYGNRIVETWDALVQLQKDGKARSIGVSNFGIKHLEALRQHGRKTPAVNQIEMHPLIYMERQDLIDYCIEHNIIITAYGSLFFGESARFDHPLLQKLKSKYKKTVPQVLLRWALQNGFAVIPKSTSSRKRLEENFAILDFELTIEDIQAVTEMQDEPFNAYWNPVRDAGVDIGDLSYGQETKEETPNVEL